MQGNTHVQVTLQVNFPCQIYVHPKKNYVKLYYQNILYSLNLLFSNWRNERFQFSVQMAFLWPTRPWLAGKAIQVSLVLTVGSAQIYFLWIINLPQNFRGAHPLFGIKYIIQCTKVYAKSLRMISLANSNCWRTVWRDWWFYHSKCCLSIHFFLEWFC